MIHSALNLLLGPGRLPDAYFSDLTVESSTQGALVLVGAHGELPGTQVAGGGNGAGEPGEHAIGINGSAGDRSKCGPHIRVAERDVIAACRVGRNDAAVFVEPPGGGNTAGRVVFEILSPRLRDLLGCEGDRPEA